MITEAVSWNGCSACTGTEHAARRNGGHYVLMGETKRTACFLIRHRWGGQHWDMIMKLKAME
jgi:hypothetical protein